jgi:hypothetical protein
MPNSLPSGLAEIGRLLIRGIDARETPRRAALRELRRAGEGIDHPGAQFGTDGSTGDVFLHRCRALPANTISTRSNFIAHLAKPLHSTGQVVRLPLRFPQPTAPCECGGLWLRRCAWRGSSPRSTRASDGPALAGCRRHGAGDGVLVVVPARRPPQHRSRHCAELRPENGQRGAQCASDRAAHLVAGTRRRLRPAGARG